MRRLLRRAKHRVPAPPRAFRRADRETEIRARDPAAENDRIAGGRRSGSDIHLKWQQAPNESRRRATLHAGISGSVIRTNHAMNGSRTCWRKSMRVAAYVGCSASRRGKIFADQLRKAENRTKSSSRTRPPARRDRQCLAQITRIMGGENRRLLIGIEIQSGSVFAAKLACC